MKINEILKEDFKKDKSFTYLSRSDNKVLSQLIMSFDDQFDIKSDKDLFDISLSTIDEILADADDAIDNALTEFVEKRDAILKRAVDHIQSLVDKENELND